MGWVCSRQREVIGWLGRRKGCRWRGLYLLFDREERCVFVATIDYASVLLDKYGHDTDGPDESYIMCQTASLCP